MKKRFLPALLAVLCVILGLFSGTALAAGIVASGDCGDRGNNVTWALDADGTLDISGNGVIINDVLGGHPPVGWIYEGYTNEIKKVVIHSGITSVEWYSFAHCSNLTTVTLPSSLTFIDVSVFEDCGKLSNVYYSGTKAQWGQVQIDNELDGNAPLLNATIHCSDGDIPPKGIVPAENRCGNDLTWELSGDGTLTIQGTGKMWDFDITTPAPWWDKSASIKKIVLKDGVTCIGVRAFASGEFGNPINVTSITIPHSITNIEPYAFSMCRVKDVYYAGTEAQWMQIAIDNEYDGNASLVNSAIHYSGTGTTSTIGGKCGDNLTWKLKNGVLTISGTGEMWGDTYTDISEVSWHTNKNAIRKVVIENGVTSIGKWAFCDCSNLTSVTIPNSVVLIWDWAFAGCSSLTGVTIPNPNAFIGEIAFGNCSGLKSITIPKNTVYINKFSFSGCSSLTGIVIPDKVTDIIMYAFSDCTNLSYAVIPSSVTNIGPFAFDDCGRLSDIYYSGTESQWKLIHIDDELDGNSPLHNATIHYNSTGPAYAGFTDVTADDYFAEPVKWAVGNKITNGTSKTLFSPQQPCSISQILTFLYRAKGSPAIAIKNPFSDVSPDNYYYSAALWAYQNGLVSGGKLDGGNPCTRAMAINYLWKLAGSPIISNAGSHFSDVPASASYAVAVEWAVKEGVTNGTAKTTFSPDLVCNRGQIITFLYRAMAQ